MGLGVNSVMVVHGGGVYGDKEATKKRWAEQYNRLPQNVRNRLVLENCERCFSIVDCLDVSKMCGVPVVFDTHHFACYKLLHPDESFEDAGMYMQDILETWQKRGVKPKVQWLLNLWCRTEVCLLGLNSSFPFYNWTSFIN